MKGVAMDFFGPLKPSQDGNQYVFVLQDISSSAFLQTILMELGSQNLFTPAHHPQSNGQVERMMQTLRTMLATYASEAEWDKWLRHLRWAYNTSYHPSIKDTPFFLMHGRDPNGPVHYKNSIVNLDSNMQSYKSEVTKQLDKAFDVVRHLHCLPESQVQTLDIGDAVLLRLEDSHALMKNSSESRKLSQDGPNRSASSLSYQTHALISPMDRKPSTTFHVKNLKRFFSRE